MDSPRSRARRFPDIAAPCDYLAGKTLRQDDRPRRGSISGAAPLSTSNTTAAAIFRTIEAARPTLLIDEADTFLTNNEEIRGVLNSGHRRSGAFVLRLVGDRP